MLEKLMQQLGYRKETHPIKGKSYWIGKDNEGEERSFSEEHIEKIFQKEVTNLNELQRILYGLDDK